MRSLVGLFSSAAMRGISHSPLTEGIEVSRTTAVPRGSTQRSEWLEISAKASAVRRCRRLPSMVSETPRAPRSNTFRPSQSSSLAICRLTAPWVMLSFSAAAEKLPVRAAASKARSVSSGTIVSEL